MAVFADRRDAGARLALELQGYAERPDVVVVAASSGGIPVGYEIAVRLGLPLIPFDARSIDEQVSHHTVIVTVDGVETAATMIPTLAALRSGLPDELVAAIPVGCADACATLTPYVDDLVCLVESPRDIELAYRDFSQGSDADARDLMERASRQSQARSHREARGGWARSWRLSSLWGKAMRVASWIRAMVGSRGIASSRS